MNVCRACRQGNHYATRTVVENRLRQYLPVSFSEYFLCALQLRKSAQAPWKLLAPAYPSNHSYIDISTRCWSNLVSSLLDSYLSHDSWHSLASMAYENASHFLLIPANHTNDSFSLYFMAI